MIITYFKTVFEKSTPFYKPVDYALKRIKEGASKDLIFQIQSVQKEDQKNLKERLPVIRFAGEFKQNNDNSLVKASGLMILDFDKYESIETMLSKKNYLKEDKYTFSVFISPSGNGLKVLVKIPPANKDTYKRYFEAISDYYNDEHFDNKNSNISRACFESYDPEIYINENSVVWEMMSEEKQLDYRDSVPLIKLENVSEIVKRVFAWFNRKYSMTEGNRNSNLFILASALSDYGIDEFEAKRICQQFESDDFDIKEIERTIVSAYSRGKSNFGMKYFEDLHSLEYIKDAIKIGKSINEIKKKLPHVDEGSYERIKELNTINDFWEITKNGKVILKNIAYKNWLEKNGFYKFYPDGSDTFVFVKIENNLIDNTSADKIKDFVLNELIEMDELKVYDAMANNPKLFKDDRLNIVEPAKIAFKEDTPSTAYLYFKNGALKVMADKVELIDYIDLNGYVWKKHIINHDYVQASADCDFSRFIDNICDKSEERFRSICSTIGYLLHSYKTSAKNVAVILNDEVISENPNGGTGKGIFINAISKLKRVSIIDGKTFSFDKSFPYQTVSADTQIIVFDDVRKNFNFENLFSIVTEGIIIEKKNKDAIKLPIDKSPKVLISTNYAVGGEGNSFERRKWDVEFAQHYNNKHTPIDDFGRLLFDEWNEEEWMKFYNFMIRCLQFYLKEGLYKTEFKNIKERIFIKNTCFEFNEWVSDESNLELNIQYVKSEIYEYFINEYPDLKKYTSQKKFSGWLEKYANYKGWSFTKDKVLNKHTITFKNESV